MHTYRGTVAGGQNGRVLFAVGEVTSSTPPHLWKVGVEGTVHVEDWEVVVGLSVDKGRRAVTLECCRSCDSRPELVVRLFW